MGRKSRGNTKLSAQVSPECAIALREMAETLGFTYAGKGSPGLLLEAIARHKDVLIPLLKNLEEKG